MPEQDTTVFTPPKTVGEKLLYWKLAIIKCSGKMFAAGANSLITTLNGANWIDFTGSQKVVALLTMCVAMWQVMDAFLNQTMSALSKDDKAVIASETTVHTETKVN